ncbi:MAG TPA: 3-hydroxyacyl-ACP dehydratase FabZ [Armatimonadota bacterium]|jgi:3-hydroxyacyl-[acyl-carrier-protein] dehydratase
MKNQESQTLDIEGIREILPHRYPFLLVDRIHDLVPGQHATGIKNVTVNEEFFAGHFPGYAIMPGVLIVEAMAQVAGVMLLSVPQHAGKLAVFAGIDRTKFRRPVTPGDVLITDVEILRLRGSIGKASAVARVDGQIVAEGEFMFALVDKPTDQEGNSLPLTLAE